MEITREYLEKRIKELRANSEQLKNNSIATKGAADGLQSVLDDLNKTEVSNGT